MFQLYIMNQWLNLNVTYTLVSIDRMLKLYQGQGHKVKGQGQICSFLKNIVSAISHEPIIGHWWWVYTW